MFSLVIQMPNKTDFKIQVRSHDKKSMTRCWHYPGGGFIDPSRNQARFAGRVGCPIRDLFRLCSQGGEIGVEFGDFRDWRNQRGLSLDPGALWVFLIWVLDLILRLDTPALYTEREIRLHLQRFVEAINMYQPGNKFGKEYGASFYGSIAAPVVISEEKSGKTEFKKLFKNFNVDSVDPFTTYAPGSSFVERGQKFKCIKSINYSNWNPVPADRHLKGDLVYLNVVTLENQSLEIVGTMDGFYVSRSTADKFDPTPRKDKPCHGFSLYVCLAAASPKFVAVMKQLQEFTADSNSAEYLHTFEGARPWCLPEQTLSNNHARAFEAHLRTVDTNESASYRDWNEDMLCAREMPKGSGQERMFRDQHLIRLYYDFIEASVQGAVSIAHKNISPIVPTDPVENQIFMHNNIFYSTGYDSRDPLLSLGGQAAAHVAASKEIDGVQLVSDADVDGVSPISTVVVDYLGRRLVCQSIIPGILRRDDNKDRPLIQYGSSEDANGDRVIHSDSEFHEAIKQLSEVLHLKEHSVFDKNGDEHSLFTSVDAKGVVGEDGRRYLLDIYRLLPVDINFLESVQDKADGIQEEYPHRLCLIRPELMSLFWNYKMTQHVSAFVNKRVFLSFILLIWLS